MPTIPSGTKFMGINPDVNTDEKRSSLSNSYQEFYTIDDIVAEASAADTNIYNSDGTLDANRTVDLDGNTLLFNNGNIGINVTSTMPLQIQGTAIPSTAENLFRVTVSDVPTAHFTIQNSTTADGNFLPKVVGRQALTSNETAINYAGVIDSTQDSGTNPVTVFQSHLSTLAAVVTRPLFQWKNWSTNLMTMLANGNLGIGTTTPGEKLEVSGKTKTTTFQMTTAPTAGYVLTSDASGNGTWSPITAGLTYFTEAQNTSAPNGTVYVDSLTAAASSTNADFAIIPKGNGALLAEIPDGAFTNGNKRGSYATDWQRDRNSADRVASGAYSTIIGGIDCKASNNYSIAGGASAISTGSYAIAFGQVNANGFGSISIGYGNSATADYSFCSGYSSTASNNGNVALGFGVIASGAYCVALGQSNVANGDYSLALGRQSHTFGIIGRQVYASGQEATTGDSQASKFVLHERTTGNTATTLTSDSGAASTNNQVILSNQSAYRFKGSIVGKQSGSTNAAVWDIDGFIVRGANAAATTLNVSNVTLVQNTPAWGTPTLAADTTNGGLRVQVTGAAATNIQWTAVIETTEVIYA